MITLFCPAELNFFFFNLNILFRVYSKHSTTYLVEIQAIVTQKRI